MEHVPSQRHHLSNLAKPDDIDGGQQLNGTRLHGFGQVGHESSSEIVMMHTDISRAYSHAPCKEYKSVELPTEMWSKGCNEYCAAENPF